LLLEEEPPKQPIAVLSASCGADAFWSESAKGLIYTIYRKRRRATDFEPNGL
jgi:hypothetical protein